MAGTASKSRQASPPASPRHLTPTLALAPRRLADVAARDPKAGQQPDLKKALSPAVRDKLVSQLKLA